MVPYSIPTIFASSCLLARGRKRHSITYQNTATSRHFSAPCAQSCKPRLLSVRQRSLHTLYYEWDHRGGDLRYFDNTSHGDDLIIILKCCRIICHRDSCVVCVAKLKKAAGRLVWILYFLARVERRRAHRHNDARNYSPPSPLSLATSVPSLLPQLRPLARQLRSSLVPSRLV